MMLRFDVEVDANLHSGMLGALIDALGRYRLFGTKLLFDSDSDCDPIVFLHVSVPDGPGRRAKQLTVRMQELSMSDRCIHPLTSEDWEELMSGRFRTVEHDEESPASAERQTP
jgi:hypothetical protein